MARAKHVSAKLHQNGIVRAWLWPTSIASPISAKYERRDSLEESMRTGLVLATVTLCVLAPATAQAQQPQAPQPAQPSAQPLSAYHINAGDELEIYVWGEERLQRTVKVLPGRNDCVPAGRPGRRPRIAATGTRAGIQAAAGGPVPGAGAASDRIRRVTKWNAVFRHGACERSRNVYAGTLHQRARGAQHGRRT